MQSATDPIPEITRHPAWCDERQHRMFVEESAGLVDLAEVTAHHRGGGNAALSELRNAVSGRVERRGVGSWSLMACQALHEPYTDAAAYAGPPLVQLRTVVRHGRSEVRLDMTTGEARVLAAHLLALCDRVDLAELA